MSEATSCTGGTTEMDMERGSTIKARMLADHRRVEALMDRLTIAFEANDREDVLAAWTDFDASLTVHLEAEETYLVPRLLRSRPREARAILAEHRHLRSRLLELGAGVDLGIVRLETARTFLEDLRAHARREEDVYDWAEANLDEEERSSLLSRIGEAALTALHVPKPKTELPPRDAT